MIAPDGAVVSKSYHKTPFALSGLTKEKQEAETGKLEGPFNVSQYTSGEGQA